MNAIRKLLSLALLVALILMGAGCEALKEKDSDKEQRQQQEQLSAEATRSVGMPAVKNFRERRVLKDIIEMRDRQGLVTYTYVFSPMLGKFIFLGETVGYGIPAATQYTNPMKEYTYHGQGGAAWAYTIPQADPNGLFSPASADATWILMLDPDKKAVSPQYIEERVTVFTFKLPARLVVGEEEVSCPK